MKKRWLARCFQWKVNILAALLVAIALVLTFSRVLVVVLANHPVFVEKWVGAALKQSVKIQSIRADWMALDPGITFKNVLVKNDDQQTFIEIKRLALGIDIIRSLLHWKLLPGRLTIEGANLDVDYQNNRLQVRGIVSAEEDLHLSGHVAALTDLVNWVLAEGNVDVKDVSVRYHSKAHKTYFLKNVHIRVKNNFFIHRIYGGATINAVSPTEIRFSAKLDNIDFSDSKFDANLYFQLRDIQLSQWAHSAWLAPYLKAITIKEGREDLELWADWRKTKITALVGRLHFKNVDGVLSSINQTINIRALFANFFWYPPSDKIYLDVRHILFSLPKKYRSPLLLKNLKLQLNWSHDYMGLHFYVPQYQFYISGLESHGQFYLTLPPSGKPILDSLSSYRFKHFSQLPDLFPNFDRRSSLNKWLHQAFLKGEIQNATVAYRGPIEWHPFQQYEGHLSAEVQVRDLSLSYYFGWPMLSSSIGVVDISNRQINANFSNASLGNNRFETFQANVKDIFDPSLNIVGVLHSNISSLYQFFQASPVISGKAPSTLSFHGPIDLNMSLNIDFTKPNFPIQSDGEINVLGSLLNFNVRTLDSMMQLGLKGNLNLTEINKQSSVNLLKGIYGQIHCDALAEIYKSKQYSKKMDLMFSTDMRGLTISELPKFFDKSPKIIDPLKIHIVHYRKRPIEITIRYRDDIFMRLLATDKQHHIKLRSGAIYVGQKPPGMDASVSGFVIYGKLANFNWAVWKPFIMPFIREVNGAIDIPEIFGLPLRYVELQFKQLKAYHQSLTDMNFKLIPRDHDWMFQMNSPEVAGTFFIPNYSGGTWAGNLDHLFVPKIKSKKTKKKRIPLNINPKNIPPIDLEIKQLHYGNADYGHFQLRTRPTAQGISINNFLINAPLFILKMKGTWDEYRHHPFTSLTGYFQVRDLGRLLLSSNIKNVLLRGRGIARFRVSWPNAIDRVTPKILNGKVIFNLHHGRILKMDESKSTELSLGRVLNAFSLEELPRRLTFHFGDITAKGLEFRSLKGTWNIRQGICKTVNTILDSPVAKLKINGKINFPRKYYDLDVSVAPYVTSSVPLIVGIAGGPIAGLIAWVVNKIASPEIGKMFGFVYHAKGSWDKSKDQKLPLPAETHISTIKKHHGRPY